MNNNNPNSLKQPSFESSSDLAWIAFFYIANELDAEARREFEIRLEHDQIARDAVVRAYDNTRLLDLAISSTANLSTEPTCELPKRESRPKSHSSHKPINSISLWPKALLGIAAAGLLAMMFTQSPWGPAGTEVALNAGDSNVTTELTEASMSLAETWADSDWPADLQALLADIETSLTCDHKPSSQSEQPEDTSQDDWMTATLIDMAENSPQSGS